MASLVLWAVLGALAGAFAKVVFWENRRASMAMALLLGIAGGCVGGLLRLGLAGLGLPRAVPRGFDVFSLLLALLGATLLLYGYHRLLGRRSAAQAPRRQMAA